MTLDRVRVVTFDFYGALVNMSTAVSPRLNDLIVRNQRDVSVETLFERWRWKRFNSVVVDACLDRGRTPLTEITRTTLKWTLGSFGLEAEPAELEGLVHAWEEVQPFPDVAPALNALKKTLRVVLLTNVDRHLLETVAARIDVPFDTLISSEDAGVHKPSVRPFEKALEKLKVAADEVLHVAGASSEMAAARAAGYQTAQLNRAGRPVEHEAAADLVVGDLWELAEHLLGDDAPARPESAGEPEPPFRPVNLNEFESAARHVLPSMAYHYIAGGSANELTLRRNAEIYASIQLKPRVLRDVHALDTSLELLGFQLRAPILLAPTSYHKLVHPDGEAATARAAGAAGTILTISTFSTTGLKEVAEAATGPLWFQLYFQRERDYTQDLLAQIEDAGYSAVVFTVDLPCPGTRDRDQRTGFHLPKPLQPMPLVALGERIKGAEFKREAGIFTPILDPSLDWTALDWLRSNTKLPILVKGVLAPEDGALAVEHGADAVIVSNHGARNLDTTPSTLEALPHVVESVGGKIPVLFDGGIRRGTDVLKALALGASATFIGRPYLWALAAEGETGVQRAYEMLHTELKAAMALCGTVNLAAIDRSVLWERS